MKSPMKKRPFAILGVLLGAAGVLSASQVKPAPKAAPTPTTELSATLDKIAQKWVDDTLKKMTLDEKVGQLLVPSLDSTYLATDTDEYDRAARLVTDLHVGGIHLFGGTEPAPSVLLDDHYGSTILGDPLAAASTLNRLQNLASIPLIATSDFEAGVGFRMRGATAFPRQMAVSAAGDTALAFEAARTTALEGRAVGVHVAFAPLADVNNNARNPVINTRSFGESPDVVGKFVVEYVRGLHSGGMLATLKHFPGHGDTDVDSHLGLPIISKPRDRLDQVELPPFREGITAGADAVMTAHIELPALDPAEFSPASLSKPIVTGLLRGDLKFDGLVFTDAMTMDAIAQRMSPGDAAVRAIEAGDDVVLNSPDNVAAAAAIKAAVTSGDIPAARLDDSVRRLLTAKARLGLYKSKTVAIDDVTKTVGGRQHALIAQQIAQKSITLLKDDRNQVPLRAPRDANVLVLSLLDYASGWRIGAPGATLLPALKDRWPHLTAMELTDRATPAELDLVRASAPRYDAIVAAVFVRAASASGRQDLPAPLAKLLTDLAHATSNTPRPLVAVFFGNPYAAMAAPELPAVLLTYDFYALPEAAAAHALTGDAPISGRLPIALPGMFEAGWGLVR
jgi:beta-glucosidase-like glycosyl hydrolase